MKGMTGLLLAIGLGVIGAVANWIYVAKQGAAVATVEFVGVKPNTRIDIGQVFVEDHFEKVPIPRNRAGTLEGHAFTWDARQALLGYKATRTFTGGELVLIEDTRTTSRKSAAEKAGKEEVVKWVPVDTRAFVSKMVNPGDLVAFTLSAGGTGPNAMETIGPFRILALGTRGGEVGVQRASGGATANESVLSIAVKMKNPPKPNEAWDGELETKAERLFELLRTSGYQAAEVTLFSEKLDESN